jgi:hypothetical protein
MSAFTTKRPPLLPALLCALALTLAAVPGAASAAPVRGGARAHSATSKTPKPPAKGGPCRCPRGTSDPSYCENGGDDGHGNGHDSGHGHEASHGHGGRGHRA